MASANPCEDFLGRPTLAALELLVSRVGVFQGDSRKALFRRQRSKEGGQVFRGNRRSAMRFIGETAAGLTPGRFPMRHGAQPACRVFAANRLPLSFPVLPLIKFSSQRRIDDWTDYTPQRMQAIRVDLSGQQQCRT